MAGLKLNVGIILIISLLFVNTTAQAQDERPKGTIEDQFETIVENSSRYQDFKVVKETALRALRSNVLDTLKKLKNNLKDNNNIILSHKADMDSVKAELVNTNNKLEETLREKNSVSLLGIQMSKDAYSTTMWTIFFVLAFVLMIFVILFKRSNKITVQNKQDLEETRMEFEKFRKRALEREQELSRNHLAELNKYRKSSGV
jgi:hypothetical protein